MSALTSYIRQPEAVGQTPRQALTPLDNAVQTELEAMHTIARALASLPDGPARARVVAWAESVFARTEPVAAQPGPDVMAVSMATIDGPSLESFESEDSSATRPAGIARFAPVIEAEAPADPSPIASPAPDGDVPEPLSEADIDALSIKDVDTFFADARPPQGQFPPRPVRPRLLRPRLVLRFRLWR